MALGLGMNNGPVEGTGLEMDTGTLIDIEPALVLLIPPGNPRLREERTL